MDTPEGKKAVINAIAPKDNNQKAIRPKQSRHWIYYSRDGQPLVRVCREFWRWADSHTLAGKLERGKMGQGTQGH